MVKIEELKEYWDNNIDKFLSIVESVEYQPKGIWYTEAFLFCSICDFIKSRRNNRVWSCLWLFY